MANAPDKPLASGAVSTDTALLLSSGLYCAVLIVACFMVRACLCFRCKRERRPDVLCWAEESEREAANPFRSHHDPHPLQSRNPDPSHR
jgi:hypothetical protein